MFLRGCSELEIRSRDGGGWRSRLVPLPFFSDHHWLSVSVPQSVYRINSEPSEEAQQGVFSGDSERWWEETLLSKLYLSSNQLTQLSEDIRLLPALTVLDVSKSSREGLCAHLTLAPPSPPSWMTTS